MARLGYLLLAYFCLTMALVNPSASADEKILLSSGHRMPVVGLGTWQLSPDDVDAAITAALDDKYEHIDTAFVYDNEEAIGASLKKYFDKGGKREDLFITTKLPPVGSRAEDVETFLNSSLTKLGLDYVDMYLIHTAITLVRQKDSLKPVIVDGAPVMDYTTDHISTWKAMEAQVKAGRARSIGLSNFNQSQIQRVIDNAEIKPSNLQIELQAYNQQKPLRKFCKMNNIAITAYSSLGSLATAGNLKTANFQSLPKLIENPVVTKIAADHGKKPAQVLLRHQVQNGLIVIPKSKSPNHIKENHDLWSFKLTPEEMKQLDDLDMGEKGRQFDFLVFKGIEKHPEYPWTEQLKLSKAN